MDGDTGHPVLGLNIECLRQSGTVDSGCTGPGRPRPAFLRPPECHLLFCTIPSAAPCKRIGSERCWAEWVQRLIETAC